MSGPQCCENPPSLNSNCGTAGLVEELGGLKSYVVGSPDSHIAILLISDIFGYEAPKLRKLADKVSAAGFYVVVPDFMHGDPYVPEDAERPLLVWIKDHGPERGFDDAKLIIEAIKSKGVSKIGAAGFCWGAKPTVNLAKHAYVQAAAILHPSFVTVEDIQDVKVPISILGAEIDHMSPPEPKPYLHLAKPFKVSPIHSEISASSIAPLVSNGASVQGTSPSFLKPIIGELELGPAIEVDRVVESELKESGFRSTRKTKIVCTIGPATCGFDELEALAVGGMNVARLNMCHGTRDWHRSVIEKLRRLNEEKGFVVAIMMDTQGSEIHMGDLAGSSSAKVEDGDVWTFSMRSFDSELPERTVSVNYDGFAEDVYIGDELIVDGGMARFEVIQKIGPDVKCLCTDPGLLLPRANLTFWRNGRLVQERNAMLPTISAKDWLDIDFGISEGVDFIAVSFVKSAEVINHLKRYLAAHSHDSVTSVISKIENVDSLKNLDTIIQASDGVMVARGDLGAQIPLEQVPSVQKKIVEMCRELNKPVIVASQLLESMIEYPIPTRAEVADVTEVVRQQADALMLSGESAMGLYPFKALSVLRSISLRIEKWWREDKYHEPRKLSLAAFTSPNFITNELCTAAASMANKLGADALFVYTKSGHMASLLSQCRPDCPIFAFTPSVSVRRRMNLQWGLVPFCLNFSEDDDSTINKTFAFLKARGMIKPGDTIISVSDTLQSIQVVNVPQE